MWETRAKEYCYTVCHPVYENHVKVCQYTVCKPVWETCCKEIHYTVCVPVQECCEREVCYQVCKPVHCTQTVNVCCGHWETRVGCCEPACNCCDPCCPACQCRVWVPEVQQRQIDCVKYVTETCVKKVPYTVCRMVPQERVKTCTYQVCHIERNSARSRFLTPSAAWFPRPVCKCATTRYATWCRKLA